VAEKAGISAPYLSDIERGRRAPPRSTLEKLLVAIKHLKNP
jgi:transcriptional regulator with XRE-family HTH domain